MRDHGRFSRFVVAENGGPRGCRARSNTSMMIMRPPQQRKRSIGTACQIFSSWSKTRA